MNAIPRHADSTAAARLAPPRSTACVQLHSGFCVDLLAPDLSGLTLTDLATHLSRIARFNGATRPAPYSVAQHSVLVAQILEAQHHTLLLQRAALLHDAHEALMGDIATPVKIALGRHVVHELEARLQAAIAWRFGLLPSLLHHWAVQEADAAALATEWRDLMSRTPGTWPQPPAAPLAHISVQPWRESMAHVNFMRHASRLGLG